MQSISVILHLNRNDEINIRSQGYDGAKLRDDSNHRFTHFMGYLLKQDVGFDGQKNGYTTTSGIITYDSTSPNHGNGMDTSTGIFTAPKPGIYAFHFHGMASASSSPTNVSLRHNNVQVADSHEGSNQDQTISMSVVLTLEQNDQVSVYLKKGQLRDRKSTFTRFIGYLLF